MFLQIFKKCHHHFEADTANCRHFSFLLTVGYVIYYLQIQQTKSISTSKWLKKFY